jgi:hypothetical protein
VATPASKREGGAAHAKADVRRRRNTEAKVRQQKSEDRDATLDLLLKHSDTTFTTYV